MPRSATTSLVAASALVLAGCVAEEEPPAPSLTDQLRGIRGADGPRDPAAGGDAPDAAIGDDDP